MQFSETLGLLSLAWPSLSSAFYQGRWGSRGSEAPQRHWHTEQSVPSFPKASFFWSSIPGFLTALTGSPEGGTVGSLRVGACNQYGFLSSAPIPGPGRWETFTEDLLLHDVQYMYLRVPKTSEMGVHCNTHFFQYSKFNLRSS